MNIHEYQAKNLLKGFGVPVPNGHIAFTAEEAVAAAKLLSTPKFVVKAQIHAGGRGKGGGVKVVSSHEEVRNAAAKMIGMTLITHQTGPEGRIVNKVYIEEASNIKKEYYLSAVLDREQKCITFIASQEGGVDIEEVAEHHPDKIIKVNIEPKTGYSDFHGRKLAYGLELDANLSKQMGKIARSLYEAVMATDAMQIEINPLIETAEGNLLALDAKMNFDSNALYKHPHIVELRDMTEEEPLEIEASRYDLNYIKMDGQIGCMVNGAGLAMATMDIIKLYGSSPANFLDVGGGANEEKVREALKLILSDKAVKGILINIFGGIMRCDIIANGVINAAKDIGIKVPVVVRLEGTNSDKGKELLKNSGLNLVAADNLADAAKKIVNIINGAK